MSSVFDRISIQVPLGRTPLLLLQRLQGGLREAVFLMICRPAQHAIALARPRASIRIVGIIVPPPLRCRLSSTSLVDTIVREGDIVLLASGAPKHFQYLSKPLRHGSKIDTHYGTFADSSIIGRPYRSLVAPSSGKKGLRILVPTLEEYVTSSPRLVTPIYAQDANLIVSLLDIHVLPPLSPTSEPFTGPKLEILEAGTGHGSLTVHLARAIQAANVPLPESLLDKSSEKDAETLLRRDKVLCQWKSTRRAVIHTVEQRAANSFRAQKIVAGFRHGMYIPHVDFHVGDVADFMEKSMMQSRTTTAEKQEQVFSHIILDLPGAHHHVRQAARALKDGGTLLLFCPSVTQIVQAVKVIREHKLPLSYSNVLEFGTGMTGGKQWDVRAAKIRNPAPPAEAVEQTAIQRFKMDIARFFGIIPPDKSAAANSERWEMVARPTAGHGTVGGGFVGIWQRKRHWEPYEEELADAEARPPGPSAAG